MTVTIDTSDERGLHLLEVLKGLPYVEMGELSKEDAQLIADLKESFAYMNDVKLGLKEARPIEELLNEL
ncbi:MAG: hypothetical protein Kapaf2KO_23610 [Candidatus Kapaibacteriales bacterium]